MQQRVAEVSAAHCVRIWSLTHAQRAASAGAAGDGASPVIVAFIISEDESAAVLAVLLLLPVVFCTLADGAARALRTVQATAARGVRSCRVGGVRLLALEARQVATPAASTATTRFGLSAAASTCRLACAPRLRPDVKRQR
jgi:hypothetical protein